MTHTEVQPHDFIYCINMLRAGLQRLDIQPEQVVINLPKKQWDKLEWEIRNLYENQLYAGDLHQKTSIDEFTLMGFTFRPCPTWAMPKNEATR